MNLSLRIHGILNILSANVDNNKTDLKLNGLFMSTRLLSTYHETVPISNGVKCERANYVGNPDISIGFGVDGSSTKKAKFVFKPPCPDFKPNESLSKKLHLSDKILYLSDPIKNNDN